MIAGDDSVDELATRLAISPQAIEEAIRRGLLSFEKHRNSRCWRFGDSRNASFRPIDGEPFRIKGQSVKAEAETRGESWHQLIGIDDVFTNDRREILLVTEGSKDALAALHFADAEGRLSSVALVAALGTGVTLCADDVEKFRGRRVRIFGDTDAAGQETVARVAKQLLQVAEEVQIFSLDGLHCKDGALAKDLFDLRRIDCDDFEANRDLWSITDLNSTGERVSILRNDHEFSFSPLPHVCPESHEFPVYPVSNCQELKKQLEELAVRNACNECDTARERRWQLLRDLVAVEKRICRKLSPDELTQTFNTWHRVSERHLDPKKTRNDYCGLFLAEIGKVRVPTGEGEALKTALARISKSPLPEIPGMPDAPESWRTLAALHRELARQAANGAYFLSCRDAAEVHPDLNKDSANTINRALDRLGVIKLVRVGVAQPGGKASEFRYLLPK